MTLTRYGENLNRDRPLPDYPRPQFVRESYLNLNGPWQYAITRSAEPPARWDGNIVVPFCPESTLSGVGRVVGPEDYLWYRRRFPLPESFVGGRLLLHFGAVDQNCVVWVNGREAGRHSGGYLPFYFDITSLLCSGRQEVTVMVTDPTDTAHFSRGRQRLEQGGCWHSPVSGIWQTVWIECVPVRYIASLRVTPLYDEGAVEVLAEGSEPGMAGRVNVYAQSHLAAGGEFTCGEPVRLKLPGALSWSPGRPFLYTLKLTAGDDTVGSYFGMRKFSVERGEDGNAVLCLNNKPFVGAGVLDQGLFSDGLYTPPAYAAMGDDLRFAKACGFNIIRKHGKVEPMYWYYLCDKLGLVVWQDLPAGGEAPKPTLGEKLWNSKASRGDGDYAAFGRGAEEGRAAFLHDMAETAACLYNVPSLAVYVLFQDGVGQFDAADAARRMKQLDPTRLVDHASGRYDQGAGDILSLHLPNTPHAKMKKLPALADSRRAGVLSEAGGFGLEMAGHFCGTQPFAPAPVDSREALAEAIAELYRQVLLPLRAQGMSAFVFRQLSDAGDEVDGLLTCDRREQKLHPKGLQTLNAMLF